jgi:hypothetical protein
MGRPNAYTTMQRARSLRERHPDASPSHVAIALALASFADGPTGTSIRPGYDRIAEITGLNVQTVHRRIRWLVKRGELRRDKKGWRGSAACFTWVGGMVVPQAPPLDGMVVPHVRNGGASGTTHQSHPSEPSGLPGPRDGESPHPGWMECSICRKRAELNADGLCAKCQEVWDSGDAEAIERLTR